MLQRVDVGTVTGTEGDDDAGSLLRPVNLSGDLDELLDTRPVFRVRLHGYDRLQVENYVSWAEDEIEASRRAGDHLMKRFAACAAELAEYRRQPTEPVVRELDISALSERVREILRLAEVEAEAIVDAAEEEADRIVQEARLEAEARLQKTQEIKAAAVSAVDRLQERAHQDRAAATALLEQAHKEAAELLRQAAQDRDRLAAEAAAHRARQDEEARRQRDAAAAVAAGRLLAAQEEVDGLRRQRAEAHEALRRLTDQIGEALRAVGAPEPAPGREQEQGQEHEPNIAREHWEPART
jgi:cell division septum initiation protein DivIVA